MIPKWCLFLFLLPSVHSTESSKNASDTKDLKPEATKLDLAGPPQKNFEKGYRGYAGYKQTKQQRPWTEGRKWQAYEDFKSNPALHANENEYGNIRGNGVDTNYGNVNSENEYSNGNEAYQKQNRDFDGQYNTYGKGRHYGNGNRQIANGYRRGSSNDYGKSPGSTGYFHDPRGYGQRNAGYGHGKGRHKEYGPHYDSYGYGQIPDNVRYGPPSNGYGYEGYVKNRYGYPDFIYGHKYRHPDQKIWMGNGYRDSGVKQSDPMGYGNGNRYISGYKDYERYGRYGGYDSYGIHRTSYQQKDWGSHPGMGKEYYATNGEYPSSWNGHYGSASNFGPNKVWYQEGYNGNGWKKGIGKGWWN